MHRFRPFTPSLPPISMALPSRYFAWRTPTRRWWRKCTTLVCLVSVVAGCTSPRQWLANGLKVGPEYCPPNVRVADDWIDSDDKRVISDPVDHAAWWATFNDPVLNELVAEAYRQNLTVREAGARIAEARRLRDIAVGNFFPQSQAVSGGFSLNENSGSAPTRRFEVWDGAFRFSWELDFWGRFRRAVAAADADLDASIFDYGDVVVTLVADVASTYVDIRTIETRLDYVQRNVENQRKTFEIIEATFEVGTGDLIDVQQAKSSLAQTKAFVPQLEIALRQSQNQLCVLLGIPPSEIAERLGEGKIPIAPRSVALGVPASSLLRRPDVRRAERNLAAQSELIGIAQSDLYPHISLTGNISLSATNFDNLPTNYSSSSSFGPSFNWDILNYGRIVGNVGVQQARFQQLLASYQQTVLLANLEAENAIVQFLRSQERLEFQLEAAAAAAETNDLINLNLEEGQVDVNRVINIQNFKTQQEESAAVARGDVAQNLISIYRALGGGWPSPFLGQPVLELTPPAEILDQPDSDANGDPNDEEELPVPALSLQLPKAYAVENSKF